MYISDSSSSEAAHRQRRLAAEQKAQVDKAYTDGAIRDGLLRQSGDAPAREDVDRFQSLMQRGGERMPAKSGAREGAQTPSTSTPARGDAARNASANAQTPAGPQTVADRFRAMMLRAFAPDAGRADDLGSDETPNTNVARGDEHAAANTGAGAADARTASARASAMRDPAPSSTMPVPSKAGEDNGKQTVASKAPDGSDASKPSSENDPSDPAQAGQAAAHKAARGEGHAAAAARRSHGDQDSTAGGGGGDKNMPLSATTPQALQADTAGAPMQPQRTHADTAPQASPAGAIAQGLAELVQKHVKQMLVSDVRGQRNGSREVLLRMQNDILPGTDLWLTRTDSGWSLRADVRSRDAYDTLLAHQDDLVERFAEASLGALSIEPVFHGDSDSQRLLASAAGPGASRPRPGERDRDRDR